MWAMVGMRNSWRPQHYGAMLSWAFPLGTPQWSQGEESRKISQGLGREGKIANLHIFQSVLQNKHILPEVETFSPRRKRRAQKHSWILQSMNNSQLNDQNLIIRPWNAPTPPHFVTPQTGRQNKHSASQLKELQSTSEFLGKSTQPERQSKNKGKIKVSGAIPTANIKQSETPSQFNTKSHTIDPLPVAHWIMLGFQQQQ